MQFHIIGRSEKKHQYQEKISKLKYENLKGTNRRSKTNVYEYAPTWGGGMSVLTHQQLIIFHAPTLRPSKCPKFYTTMILCLCIYRSKLYRYNKGLTIIIESCEVYCSILFLFAFQILKIFFISFRFPLIKLSRLYSFF